MRGSLGVRGSLLGIALALACSEPREPLRVGVNPWPGYSFLYLADELELFEAEGVPVRLVEFTSLEDARRAYERGHLDALGTTLVDVLQARQHEDRALQVVRVVDFSNGGDVIILRPGLQRIADLRGKRVAVESASLGAYILARAAEREGLGVDDFEWVAIGQVHMAEALATGEVDAVVTYPPFAVPIMSIPGATVAFDTRQIPGEVVDVIAVDSVAALDRRDDVAALLRAFDRAAAAYRADPLTHDVSLARRQNMPARDFHEAMSRDLTIVGVDSQARFLAPGGTLDGVVARVDTLLRAIGVIDAPQRRSAVVSRAFLHNRPDARQ